MEIKRVTEKEFLESLANSGYLIGDITKAIFLQIAKEFGWIKLDLKLEIEKMKSDLVENSDVTDYNKRYPIEQVNKIFTKYDELIKKLEGAKQ